MIKSHQVKKTVFKEEIDDIICNRCGKSIPKNHGIYEDHIDIYKIWNYFSDHEDEVHKCQICQACWMQIISSFKIPIEIGDADNV